MISNSDSWKELTNFRPKVLASLKEVQDLDIACKSILTEYLDDNKQLDSSCALRIEAIIDYMYEQVNIGNWKEVKLYVRKTITIASYLKLLAHFNCKELSEVTMKEAYNIIDFGILFGCPIDSEPELLQNCAAVIKAFDSYSTSFTQSELSLPDCEIKEIPTGKTFNAIDLETIDCPSMEYFYKEHILAEKPVVLNNCINHWPALLKWREQSYFIKLAGPRTVSVELGSKYTDSDWTQKLMTMEDFIKKHIYESNGPTGYLAQYQLFSQIPELKNDIIEPEYCSFADTEKPVDIMAWYGPKGTVSPLHHDPKRNLLAQVIGHKQIFLFSPEDSQYLYPHEHELLNNTARVDPRKPDLEKYPDYKEANAYYCLLKPGQLLYIPPKWWHFVESLSISFSVSFWWL